MGLRDEMGGSQSCHGLAGRVTNGVTPGKTKDALGKVEVVVVYSKAFFSHGARNIEGRRR